MKAIWTKGLSGTDKKQVEDEFARAEAAMSRLLDILGEKELKAMRATSPDWIDAGWPYKAADLNGYLRALQEVKTLIKT